MIDWTGFTWEAFAALVTGLAAVVAAVIVGLRQAGIQLAQARISSKQTDILNKQVQLEELKLRNELFDRRFDIYQKSQAFIVALSMIETPFNVQPSLMGFITSMDTARFLFHERTGIAMLALYKESLEIQAAYDGLNTAKAGTEDVAPFAERLRTGKATLQKIYNGLHESFPELWLAEIRTHPADDSMSTK